jgi:multiple sugar transport system substrate-binding protein
MKRCIVTVSVLVLGCALAFAGGGQQGQSGGAAAAGKRSVTFYTWWADAERAMGEAIVAEFEKANPNIKVEQNYVAYNDYHSKLNTVMASGVPADVFQLNEFLIKEWGNKEVIQDQRPYYLAAGINPEEFSLSSGTFSTGQKLWAISYGTSISVLFYNADMLREAGITPPPQDVTKPWTWDQYVAAAKKLTRDANGRTPNDAGFNYESLVQYGTVMPTSWIYVVPLLYTGGSSVANSAGTALEITSPAGIKVIQSIANLAKVAGDIIQKACRPSESINLKNFSEIMDQTIAPVLDKVWLGTETAQDALPPLNQVLAGKLQGVWD